MTKIVSVVLVCFALTACGTIGGAVEGAGDDLGRAGKWVRSVGR